MSSVDLVLIHPGDRNRIYQSLGEDMSAIQPPIWAAMIATFIRRHGYSVSILDAEADNLDPEEVANVIGYLNPKLAAVVVYGNQPSASTQNMSAAGEICSSIRNHSGQVKTILIGGHVAALPGRTLREEETDFVADGEGLYTLLGLLEAIGSGNTDYDKVRGLWYWSDGRICNSPAAPLIKNLSDEIPESAWDLLPMDKYRSHNWHAFGGLPRKPYAAIYTTLGCPYHCSFCCIQAPFKSGESAINVNPNTNTYRFWNTDTIIKQIDVLVNKYGINNLRIADEMFVLNRRHVDQLCDMLIERGYDLNIWGYARVDTIPDQESLDHFKRAGINWLCLGIESTSQRILDDVDKNYRLPELVQTVENIRQSGINILGNYIFGLPEDDMESMQHTLEQAIELNCEFANFYSAMAYPGSALYKLALDNNWPLPSKWSGYSQHSLDSLPLPTNYLSGSEVLKFRDAAWNTYFNNPAYLKMIERKFGHKTLLDISKMASYSLERLY